MEWNGEEWRNVREKKTEWRGMEECEREENRMERNGGM